MGIMDILRPSRRGAVASRVEPPVAASPGLNGLESPSQWNGFVLPGGVGSRAGVRVDERTALGIPATLQALRILSGVFAMTPLLYYRRAASGRQRADTDRLWELLHDRPNAYQTPFQFKELAMKDLLLSGAFMAYVSRDSAGRPTALTRLKRSDVVIAEYFDRAEGRVLFFDATLPDGTRERFAGRDIWYVSGFSRDGINGLNPIEYARDALGGAIATGQQAARFWANGGKPGTVLTSKAKIGPEAKAQMRRDWSSLYGGADSETIAVLDQDTSVEFLTHDMQQNQFVETRTFQVVDLARVWGVPPHLLFELSRATFSNIEHQSLEFVLYHMGPHYERFAQAATMQFAAPGHYFEFLTDALIKGDLKSRMEAYRLQRDMGIANANELRRRENEPDIPGPAGEQYWRPANMAISGDPVLPAAPGRNPPRPEEP